jgi:putative hydrolase of the HAD superfamily
MDRAVSITTLFVDIGGVLLTNGWDRHARKRAAVHFNLEPEFEALEDLHHLMFATYELDEFTMEEYLSRTVFHKARPFTRDQFRDFMFAQSQPYPEMLDLIVRLKARHKLKIAVVSNEARELNAYRIATFKLNGFVDFFISSCFVRMRKPDAGMFRLALDVAQAPAEQIVYIENTPMFVEIAEGLGIRSVLHVDYATTRARLDSFGLGTEAGASHVIR